MSQPDPLRAKLVAQLKKGLVTKVSAAAATGEPPERVKHYLCRFVTTGHAGVIRTPRAGPNGRMLIEYYWIESEVRTEHARDLPDPLHAAFFAKQQS